MVNFQREGSISNAHVGKEFELMAKGFFASQGMILERNFKLPVGIGREKKNHSFDLGNYEKKVVVECKSHKWTSGGNVPSAKLTVWNEAMYYFIMCPDAYRKIFFVLRDFSDKRNETLAEYYLRVNGHLIPENVEIWEFDPASQIAEKIN